MSALTHDVQKLSFTSLAIPFQFTVNLPPETCIARLQDHVHHAPPIIRLIYRNSLDFQFSPIDANRWLFYVHAHSRRMNVHAGGEVQRLEPDLTLITGHSEWTRVTYVVLLIFYMLWLLFGLLVLWLFHSWTPFIVMALLIGAIIVWNVRYMRRRSRRLIDDLKTMVNEEPKAKLPLLTT
jgi:hypothetical protein